MKDRAFIDTNILVYLYSTDEPQKKYEANSLFGKCEPFISTQVLQELSNILKKKYKVEWQEINAVIDEISQTVEVFTNNQNTIKSAIIIAEKYNFSFYDSLIISSAIESNCKTVYSEDLQHKQKIENKLQIINPFK